MIITAILSFLYLMGFFLLGQALWQTQCSLSAGEWPQVSATIESCRLIEKGTNTKPLSQVSVRYRYQVDEQEYAGTRIAFGYSGGNDAANQRKLAELIGNGADVHVYYHPQYPERAVLTYGLHQTLLVQLLFGFLCLMLVAGVHLLWWLASQPDETLLLNLSVR